jgi:hypothetical protein
MLQKQTATKFAFQKGKKVKRKITSSFFVNPDPTWIRIQDIYTGTG